MRKLKKVFKRPIETYEHGDYFVDIGTETTDSEDVFKAWLCKKGYGVKMLMFGMPASQHYEYFKACVEADVDDYIKLYKEVTYRRT